MANQTTKETKKMEEKVPKGALRFVSPTAHACVFEDKDGDESQKKLKMIAYSGGIIKNHFYWGDLAIDLEGMSFSGKKFPILENHNTDKKIAFTSKPIVTDDGLVIDPEKTKFVDTDESREFQSLSSQGFPYQSSIYAKPSVIERLEDGAKAKVNGMTINGPAAIWRKSQFKEASVCVFGWDTETKASAFSREEFENIDLEGGKLTPEDNDKKIEKKEVKFMNLAELKESHPELVAQLSDEVTTQVTADLKEKFASEKADLEAQIDDKNQKLEDQGNRILNLEKKETLRHENDIKEKANRIWKDKLASSDVAEHLYSKVKAMVSHSKFIEDGILDVQKFEEAIDAEIDDWVKKGATSSVLGSGFSEKKPADEDLDKKLAESDDATVKDMAALAGVIVE
jgi:hypothetical protein